MAVQKQDGFHTDSGLSGADLRGQEDHFCKRQADGTIVLAGDGDYAEGVISEGRDVGYHTSFNTAGNEILRVVAGGAIGRNARVQSGANGVAVAGLANSFGRCRNVVGGAGEIAEIEPDRWDADGA